MNIINKDILTVESGIIAQQCNAQGVMGSGLAKAIRDKWPTVYDNYYETYIDQEYSLDLGDIICCPITSDLMVVCCIAQEFYGRDKNKVYTDYKALEFCFKQLKFVAKNAKCPVYLPYGIGCGLANGDWGIVSAMIDEILPTAIVCKKD